MSSLLVLFLLFVIGCLVWGLISPSHITRTAHINKSVNRKHVSYSGLSLIAILFVLMAITAPKTKTIDTTSTATHVQAPAVQVHVAAKPADVTTSKEVTETHPISFTTLEHNNANLAKGKTQVTQTGQKGVETDVYTVTEVNGSKVSQTLVSKSITTTPINQIVQVGTYTAPPPTQPAPVPVPQPVQPPSENAPASNSTSTPSACAPLTNGGNCYEPGEYCRSADQGMTGVAGDGENIICENNNGLRWEPN